MSSVGRALWFCALISHIVLAGAWWWVMPSGFPLENINFWANQVLPFGVIILAVSCRLLLRKSPAISAALGVCFPLVWLSCGITAFVVFPKSHFIVWLGPFALGVIHAILWKAVTPDGFRRSATISISAVISVCLGVWLPFTQRGQDPDTRPLNPTFQKGTASTPTDFSVISLSPRVGVRPDSAEILIQAGSAQLFIQPTLRFFSRSSDRGWTLFSKEADREGPPVHTTRIKHDGNSVELGYQQDYETSLRVNLSEDSELAVEGISHLSAPIYSHLNTFTELNLTGHRKLSVEFSACPGHRIDFVYNDYPHGKPARFAYLHRDGSFRVVQASSAEKGPFHELAIGRLAQGEALAMTFFDDGNPLFRVNLEDWSAQAGVQDSPTAGYGVPVNAIEFSLQETGESSAASVFVTLAATGVGRGFQSVGHAAGTYRNRLTVETLRR